MKYEPGTFLLVPNKEMLLSLPTNVQLVYIWLCSFIDRDGRCFPSRTKLADNCNLSVKSVDRSLEILEEKGLIKKEPRFEDNKQLSNTYQLMLVSQGSVLGTLGGVPQSLGGASHSRTELNPSLTKENTAKADFVITPEKPVKPPKAEKTTYEPLLTWAESRSGRKFVHRTKQYSALKKAKENGISPSRLKDRWCELEGEDWRDGFDWTSVVSSFDKR